MTVCPHPHPIATPKNSALVSPPGHPFSHPHPQTRHDAQPREHNFSMSAAVRARPPTPTAAVKIIENGTGRRVVFAVGRGGGEGWLCRKNRTTGRKMEKLSSTNTSRSSFAFECSFAQLVFAFQNQFLRENENVRCRYADY